MQHAESPDPGVMCSGRESRNMQTGIKKTLVKNTINKIYTFSVLLIILLVSSSGCAGKMEVSTAALAGNPDAMWLDGQKIVLEGEKATQKGEKQVSEGRQQVRDGQGKVTERNERVIQARLDYQSAVTAMGGSTSPKQVGNEAKRLKAIGDRWADAINDIKSGNKLVEKGNKSIDAGQIRIRGGREQIESGSVLMRNSQRIRLGEKQLPESLE